MHRALRGGRLEFLRLVEVAVTGELSIRDGCPASLAKRRHQRGVTLKRVGTGVKDSDVQRFLLLPAGA